MTTEIAGTPGPRVRVLIAAAGILGTSLAAGLRLEGFDVVAQCQRAASLGAKARLLEFDVLVGDQTGGGASSGAIELALLLRRNQPDLGVVLLSDVEDPRLVGRSHEELPLGCRWLLKRDIEQLELLTDTIVQVANAPLCKPSAAVPRLPFTDAQIEVWRLLASGASNQQIAAVRGVSVKAVEQGVHRLARRVGIHGAGGHSRVRLARAFYELTQANIVGGLGSGATPPPAAASAASRGPDLVARSDGAA